MSAGRGLERPCAARSMSARPCGAAGPRRASRRLRGGVRGGHPGRGGAEAVRRGCRGPGCRQGRRLRTGAAPAGAALRIISEIMVTGAFSLALLCVWAPASEGGAGARREAGAQCRGGGDTAVCRGPAAGSGTERGSAVSPCRSWSVCAGDAKVAGPEEERAGISSLVSRLPICFPGG